MNKSLFNRFMAGIAVVHVKTQDEYDQFMKLLEKETSLKWAWGEKPTDSFKWIIEKEKTCIRRVVSSDMISFGDISYYDSNGYEIIEFSDLMKEENNMKFKVGDKVRVRSWDSMAKEFGVNRIGDICCDGMFLSKMKKFCEIVHTIKSVNNEFKYYSLEDDDYRFSDDMLEPVKEPTNGENKMLNKDRPEVQKVVTYFQSGDINSEEFYAALEKLGLGVDESYTKWLNEEYSPFTAFEKELLSHIDVEFKWIARDRNGTLFIYNLKPYKNTEELPNKWLQAEEGSMRYIALKDIFNTIKWEDAEPVCIDDYVNRKDG